MRLSRATVLLGLVLLLTACPRTAAIRATLLDCPTDEGPGAEAIIGPLGGTLQLGGHRLDVPAGAVTDSVTFTATLIAGDLLRFDLRANGAETYQFVGIALLTLSYAACEEPPAQAIRIYRVDPRTDQILAEVGGDANQQEQTVTASLETLSAYSLGFPD